MLHRLAKTSRWRRNRFSRPKLKHKPSHNRHRMAQKRLLRPSNSLPTPCPAKQLRHKIQLLIRLIARKEQPFRQFSLNQLCRRRYIHSRRKYGRRIRTPNSSKITLNKNTSRRLQAILMILLRRCRQLRFRPLQQNSFSQWILASPRCSNND